MRAFSSIFIARMVQRRSGWQTSIVLFTSCWIASFPWRTRVKMFIVKLFNDKSFENGSRFAPSLSYIWRDLCLFLTRIRSVNFLVDHEKVQCIRDHTCSSQSSTIHSHLIYTVCSTITIVHEELVLSSHVVWVTWIGSRICNLQSIDCTAPSIIHIGAPSTI